MDNQAEIISERINNTVMGQTWLMPYHFFVSSHIKRKTGRNEKNYKWKIVNCPRQTSSVECGFYIIRMMNDYCLNETPMRWLTSNCGGKNTYTLGEINETRNEWAAKLLERMSHS
ncbi:uncharacterized protein LOC133824463 [Humulus lupulus]|uniref:uncharacterized protein LOC133824463 n=1 Tax=Humulus lupulus TaxID=3486 RepID=UPI002B409398|nr:uncharacterized protein LOC133824463 [Humulus lupulus]